ncbi:hypothetical protein [Streptomyces sp. NPDC021622]|uniref:hypothetical protein n=1 Tax=Streptomyces sp. NPDC021622 TaxID=3155013 RepID=UPI0033C2637A
MNWDSVTLYVLAGFGVVLLILGQLRELLGKVAEVVSAWHELRSSIRRNSGPQRAPSSSHQSRDNQ